MLARLLLPLLLLTLAACTSLGVAAEDPVVLEPPHAGQCRVLTVEAIKLAGDDTPPVDCNTQHTAETFAVGTFPKWVASNGIDDAKFGAHVFDSCETSFRAFLGGDESLVMRSTVTWTWFRPTEAAWGAGARWWRCDVVGGGEESTDLVALPLTSQGILLGRPEDQWMACADGARVASSPKVPCSETHTWRAVTTVVLGEGEDTYPGDDRVAARTRNYCSESVGAWLNYPVHFEYGFTVFHRAEWKAGNRRSVCWARTSE